MNYTKFKENTASTNRYNPNQQGVFALFPAMTPKYARNAGERDAEYKETLARMYLSLAGTDVEAKNAYLRTLPPDANIQALAKVLIGDTASTGTGFIDFFLDQIQESFSEKVQISEVLSDHYVAYFFGAAPPIFTFSGTLLNSFQDDHSVGMYQAYTYLLRGTECAKRGSLLRLRYDSVIVSGTIVSMSKTLNAQNELAVPFNFQLLVKEYIVVIPPSLATTKVEESFDPNHVLTPIGSASDVRVHATMFAPNNAANNSAAGKDMTVVATDDAAKTKRENLEAQVASSATVDVTADIRGTISDLIGLPPPANAVV